MSLPSRRFLLALPLALAACGFTPVYGPGGTGTVLQNNVTIDEPSTQDGYLLTRHLEVRLGRTGAGRFALTTMIATTEEGLAINRAGDTTRFNILGAVEYVLRDTTTGEIVTSGTVDAFTGYSATGTTVSELAAERDARERLMVILGDQIIARLFVADLPS